jgi:ketosteroid isomerase-like protein
MKRFVVLALLAVSCAKPPSSTQVAAELTKLDTAWSNDAATRDAAKVASYYADAAVAYPPGEKVALGRAQAQDVWGRYFADSTFTIAWTTTEAGGAKSGDLGYTAGTYKDSFRDSTGTMVSETGKYVCVWQKQPDGTWKAIHDIWNAD